MRKDISQDFVEYLRDLKPSPTREHFLKPFIVIMNRNTVEIQKERADKRFKQTPQFLQIGSRLLFFRMF